MATGEFFSTDEMIASFDIGQVGRSPARFDFAKLENLNGHYMRASTDADLVTAIETILPEVGPTRGLPTRLDDTLRARLLAAMPGLKARARTLIELIDSAYYLTAARPLVLDEKARALVSGEATASLIAIASDALQALTDWTPEATEAAVREVAEAQGVKLGQVAQPLRAALTGRATSPGLFDVMAVLGREETLARLADQIAAAGATPANV